ncbi:MAG TPA: hypothetical protein VGK20_02745 [Candidatus Binatia bacterium]|jgi:DNA repair ATPase RecN
MSESANEKSPFDKNLKSLLDAARMFEREASLLLDRFGFDTDTVGRLLDSVGTLSAEAVRPIAAALGIADAAAVEALARDVRALLQSDARVRREQAAAAERLAELLAAVEALGSTTATLADLQSRAEERLVVIAERTGSMDAVREQRERLAEQVEALTRRIDELERRFADETGLGSPDPDENAPAGVRPMRRQVTRAVKPTTTSSKILEGLPTLEPKIRPA